MSPPLRLAFGLSQFFPHGGLQRDLLRTARACAAQGHEVHVYAGGWQGEHPPEVAVHLLNTLALTNHGRNDRLARGLRDATARERFDCIVGFTKMPGLDVYYAADPCYAARELEGRRRASRLLPRYRGMRRQEAAVFARGLETEILLIAHGEREKFIHHYGTEASRFHLLPPGLDGHRLLAGAPLRAQVSELRRKLGVDEHGHMILAVGSRFRTKGVDRMVRAMAALPTEQRARSRLVVVGRGDPGPFQRLAARLGVATQICFAGPREDLASFYHSADLLLHPSYRENTGSVLVEAMACGLPVLTTANCGFAFHVARARAGLVCPEPFEQGTLDRLLARMLTAPEGDAWRRNGPVYCKRTDVVGLVEAATQIIIGRARRQRGDDDLRAR